MNVFDAILFHELRIPETQTEDRCLKPLDWVGHMLQTDVVGQQLFWSHWYLTSRRPPATWSESEPPQGTFFLQMALQSLMCMRCHGELGHTQGCSGTIGEAFLTAWHAVQAFTIFWMSSSSPGHHT